MKIHRKTFFRIIFLLAFTLSFGINAYSDFTIQAYNIELASGSNGAQHTFSSDIDAGHGDGISQPYGNLYTGRPESNATILKYCAVKYFLSYSVWQPPKIS